MKLSQFSLPASFALWALQGGIIFCVNLGKTYSVRMITSLKFEADLLELLNIHGEMKGLRTFLKLNQWNIENDGNCLWWIEFLSFLWFMPLIFNANKNFLFFCSFQLKFAIISQLFLINVGLCYFHDYCYISHLSRTNSIYSPLSLPQKHSSGLLMV